MATSLQRALSRNIAALGGNFENLGKKVYLSFDRRNGWSVENFTGCLGFVKRALRWLGICYRSTHLKNIAPQIQREANVPQPLLNKINRCWTKKGGIVLLPPVVPPAVVAPVAKPKGPSAVVLRNLQNVVKGWGFNKEFNFTRLDDDQANLLLNYLNKMRGSADYGREESKLSLTNRMKNVLQLLDQNQEFCDKVMGILYGERMSPTCGDGVMVHFHDMEVQWHLCHKEHTLQELADVVARAQRFFDLKAHASKVVKEGGGDQAEIILYYQIMLKDRLELPIATQRMLYPSYIVRIRSAMLDAAEAEIDQPQVDLLGRSELWRDHLKKAHRESFDRIEEEYGDRMDQAFDNKGDMTDHQYNLLCKRVVREKEEALAAHTRELTNALPLVLKPRLKAPVVVAAE